MSCAAQRLSVNPIADNGNQLRFCSTCAFSAACLQNGYAKDHLRELHMFVEHIGPFKEGQHIFREGDAFNVIAAVRGGTVKTFVTDAEGREQAQGFFLPGEVIGLDAISQDDGLLRVNRRDVELSGRERLEGLHAACCATERQLIQVRAISMANRHYQASSRRQS